MCAIETFSDSPELRARPRERPVRAEPRDSPQNVPPTALDAVRFAGQPAIAPDDGTKAALAWSASATAQRVRLIGSFKLCISSSGRIQTIAVLKATGVPAYDRKLIRDMHETWRYRPFLLEGVPSPVCTAVTFIYQQH